MTPPSVNARMTLIKALVQMPRLRKQTLGFPLLNNPPQVQ